MTSCARCPREATHLHPRPNGKPEPVCERHAAKAIAHVDAAVARLEARRPRPIPQPSLNLDGAA